MNKSRPGRGRHGKKRHVLLALIGILAISICLLGGFIAFKMYQQKSFEQKIESLKKEKDDRVDVRCFGFLGELWIAKLYH